MTWDLADVIADRQMPREEVAIFLNEFASHSKVQLEKALSKERSPEKVAELEAALAETEASLEASKYTVVLEAIPARMREDIRSKSMHEFPYKRNALGTLAEDDPGLDRMKRENDLLWAAMIRDVINPNGESKTEWTVEEVHQFAEAIPSGAASTIDRTTKQLHLDSEKFTAEVKNPNI